MLSQSAWLQVLRTLRTRPFFGELVHVGNAAKLFDASGRLVDEAMRKRLRAYMEGFVAFVRGG